MKLNRIRLIIAESDKGTPLINALLEIHIADWNLLFDNTSSAAKGYKQAYEDLLAAGLSIDELDDYFDKPVLLPSMALALEWSSNSEWDNESALRIQAWSNLYPGAQRPPELAQRSRMSFTPAQLKRAQVLVKLELLQEQDGRGGEIDYRVTGLEVVDYAPETNETLSAIFQEIPQLQFRPRLVNGQLFSHDPVLVDYLFAPD